MYGGLVVLLHYKLLYMEMSIHCTAEQMIPDIRWKVEEETIITKVSIKENRTEKKRMK